ncbi:unnamed protein product [Schistosoma curassoni]|nr:unnamed protein product [Schistosoma curassoni]
MSSSSRVDSIHSPGNISISSYSLHNNHNLSNVNLEDDHSQHHHSNDVKNYGINKESIVQPTSSKDCLEDRLKYNYDQLKRLNQTLNSLSCCTISDSFSANAHSLRSTSKDKS